MKTYAAALADLPESREIEDVGEDVAAENPPPVTVRPDPYLPSPDLVRVVDLAIALGRPLLLQGEPGCGKTRLAHAVAYALEMPLEVAYVKSTSSAQDLLYRYDAVRRLYDSQLHDPKARDAANYLTYGPLGRAIIRAGHGRRSAVLIDEIDKADLDFPNDLLWELDRMEFTVPEVPGLTHRADTPRPFVVITHNEEKPLPPAFLRRCVFHYLEFPDPSEAEKILRLHGIDDEMSAAAVDAINELRKFDLAKRPGLAELIDWVRYEESRGVSPAELAAYPDVEALLKDRSDQQRARAQP
ncbi:AAA family ATPase [Actinoplanes solisilvae]|uniref:AAA family ATPase n=1 Tax=Actinoplanes solisilvae TaxID=2486853 RepID=UPI001F0B8F5C|nr:MoxR family ATPase [Actinoplanes solisilvae]